MSSPWKEASWREAFKDYSEYVSKGCLECPEGKEIPGVSYTRTIVCKHPMFPGNTVVFFDGKRPGDCPKMLGNRGVKNV